MEVIDEATAMPRGYFLLSTSTHNHTLYPLLLARLNKGAAGSWAPIDAYFTLQLPAALVSANPSTYATSPPVLALN